MYFTSLLDRIETISRIQKKEKQRLSKQTSNKYKKFIGRLQFQHPTESSYLSEAA